MNGALSHNAALQDFTRPQGKTWLNKMTFGMNHAPGAGSIARLVDLQSSMFPLCPLATSTC